MRRPTFAVAGASALIAVAACSNSDTPIAIDITPGQETTAFTDADVSKLVVKISSDIDTTLSLSATASPDGGTFDFGEIPNTEQITVTVTGLTASGTTTMAGQSLADLPLDAISGGELPVFVQQKGQWSRPPGGLACAHVGGVASVQENRAFILTGGTLAKGSASGCDATAIDTYDMLGLTGDDPTSAYGDVPLTIVSLPASSSNDALGLFIAPNGGQFWDYDTGQAATQCSVGITTSTWADLAGGGVIAGDAGEWFVVGGTRSGTPTDAVLQINADCSTTFMTLNTARSGAAAVWVEGVGLVVAGGSSTGGGYELLAFSDQNAVNTSTTFASQCQPLPVKGASIVPDGATGASAFWLVGGMDGETAWQEAYINLSGGTGACGAMVATQPPLPQLTATSAFPVTGGAILVGTDASGMTVSYLLTSTTVVPDGGTVGETFLTATPKPLREPRSGATAVIGPTNSVAILGGQHTDGTPATSIEMYVP